ncbi:hypothetical protein AVEN_271740-1, partial [Araneus ventricosus]
AIIISGTLAISSGYHTAGILVVLTIPAGACLHTPLKKLEWRRYFGYLRAISCFGAADISTPDLQTQQTFPDPLAVLQAFLDPPVTRQPIPGPSSVEATLPEPSSAEASLPGPSSAEASLPGPSSAEASLPGPSSAEAPTNV